MTDRLEPLTRHLQGQARSPELVMPAMELVQPFFRTTEPPTYGLLRPSHLRRQQLSDALGGLIGYPVERIVTVSIGRIFEERGLTEAAIGERGLQALLRRRLQNKLWDCLGNKLWDSLGRRLAPELGDAQRGQRLTSLIQDSLGANQLDSLLYGLRDLCGDCFTDGLTYYLGAVMAGETDAARQLEPLLRLLPVIVPLGERAGRPDTWYVLTA